MSIPKKIYVDEHPPLVTGPWNLSDLIGGKLGYPRNSLKVFSCFHCGGGSTMGYKLAGFDVIGGVEIDSEMMEIYRKNHSPRPELSFQMPIQDFPAMNPELLPRELFDLDVLDGSPPCSSFSMAGAREDGWNEKKMFREGQTEQVLDDLFFHFIKVADMLRPKMVIAENVKGLIVGNAKGYVKEIFAAFDKAGYQTQLFLLNASRMGVPQYRERTFFIARRKDLALSKLTLSFEEKPIAVKDAIADCDKDGRRLPKSLHEEWRNILSGRAKKYTSTSVAKPNEPCPTLTSKAMISAGGVMHWDSPRKFSKSEVVRIASFPEDYDFLDCDPGYVCGMSVPPLMMQRVATEVAKALLAKRKT